MAGPLKGVRVGDILIASDGNLTVRVNTVSKSGRSGMVEILHNEFDWSVGEMFIATWYKPTTGWTFGYDEFERWIRELQGAVETKQRRKKAECQK